MLDRAENHGTMKERGEASPVRIMTIKGGLLMKKTISHIGMMALVGACLMAMPASAAWLIPISSHKEWPQDKKLLEESEISRWHQEALKQLEIRYTDMLGKKYGSLKADSCVNDQLHGYASTGNKVLENVDFKMDGVDNLSTYDAATKKALEDKYTIQADQSLNYTESKSAEIKNRQRMALHKMAKSAVALGAASSSTATSMAVVSSPKERSKGLAEAKDVQGTYEMILMLDRLNYEQNLRGTALEAAEASIRAMQDLKGVSETALHRGGV